MQLQVKSLLSLSDLYQFLVCCASANLLHFLLMTHQKFYLVSISVFHRLFCNLTTTCSFRNIFFHLVKQTFKTFTYFCCLHTAVGFLHPRLANSWPRFRNLIREATRGIIQPVQELLFAPITDQRADKMSRIIMPKFNKVKKLFSECPCFQELFILHSSYDVKINTEKFKSVLTNLGNVKNCSENCIL